MGGAIPQHPDPPWGEIHPLGQCSKCFSTTRGPAEVGFRSKVAPISHVNDCLMWGRKHEASGSWCQTIPFFGARPSPPLIQGPTSMMAGPENNALTRASGILAPTWHAWAKDPCIVCLTSGGPIPQHPDPPWGGIHPLGQCSKCFSTTRGPAEVGVRSKVAHISHVNDCLMWGRKHEASGSWCQTIPLFGARPSPPLIQA